MELLTDEVWWRDRQRFLESRGYMLRPRYHPTWVPSWKDSSLKPEDCEDSLESLVRRLCYNTNQTQQTNTTIQ